MFSRRGASHRRTSSSSAPLRSSTPSFDSAYRRSSESEDPSDYALLRGPAAATLNRFIMYFLPLPKGFDWPYGSVRRSSPPATLNYSLGDTVQSSCEGVESWMLRHFLLEGPVEDSFPWGRFLIHKALQHSSQAIRSLRTLFRLILEIVLLRLAGRAPSKQEGIAII